jgi:phosphatidylserine/phosphatidylglycerophosphate/cardiolipin synthase-like enzyme
VKTLSRHLSRADDVLETLFFRSAGSPLVGGNAVRVLLDGDQNYPRWLDAIATAKRTIHLQMYIVHNDGIGRRFRDLLVEKARAGVAVRVLYDWFGALRPSSFRFWAPLAAAGGDVRIVNPPRFSTLLSLGSRDHRKLLTVDGRTAFIGGLCIGDDWLGDPRRQIPPWRDTGLEIRGPAVAEAELSFAAAWAGWGEGLPPGTVPASSDIRTEGDVDVRVIATSPDRTSLYRLELAALAVAESRIWLTDAYFMGTNVYIESLSAAARQGVDVRLLVPNNSDVPWVGNLSRTLYRRLLEAGVRIFEWNGPMMHAKTAVADHRFVRVGSTNLNISSWMGNWELDVIVEHPGLAAEMEEIYDRDLRNATEIVITSRRKVRLSASRARRSRRHTELPRRRLARAASGSAQRVIKDVALAGSAFRSAVSAHRHLGPHEAWSLSSAAAAALLLATIAAVWPRLVAYPLAVIAAAAAVTMAARAWRARWPGR